MNPLGVVFLDENGFTAVFELASPEEEVVDPVTDFLKEVRKNFDNYSWFRHGPKPVTGDVCAITILSRTYEGGRDFDTFQAAKARLADVIVRRFGAEDSTDIDGYRDDFYVITHWNDQPNRTRKEVELAYDLAIAGW